MLLSSPRRVLGAAAAIVLLAALAVSQLPSTASPRLLVGESSRIGEASAALERGFGQEPIVVAAEGPLTATLAPEAITKLLALEGKLAKLDGVRAVYGPATFVNQTIVQAEAVIERQLRDLSAQANAAPTAAERRRLLQERATQYRALLVRFGGIGIPSLTNRSFVNQLVFGSGTDPKARFRWLFPDRNHALVLVRPDPGVAADAALRLGREVEVLTRTAAVPGVAFRVAGFPQLAAGLERDTRAEVLRLAPVAVVAMLLLLALVLRRRRGKAVPLALALGGAVVAVGLCLPLGLGLTVATVAAMPVLLGLGLDFAVQLQARYWHERARGRGAADAARSARNEVGPTLVLAAAAMSAGFLVLLASPVPLLDRLGLVLALGTCTGAAATLLAGPALLVLTDRGPVAPLELQLPAAVRRRTLSPIALGALAAFALVGLVFSGTTRMESDLAALAPPGQEELRDVEGLQRALGTSGQVSVAVRADDVTDPAVLGWLRDVGQAVTAGDPALRPGPNLADIASGGDPSAQLTRTSVDGTLALLPRYFLDAVLTADRKTAELTWAIPFVPVAEQGRIVDRIDAAIASPPDGVTASTAGLVAAAATSTVALDGARPDLLLFAATLIGAILLGVWRDPARVLLVLGPALVAAGLVALVLALLELRLSPMGAALEPLVLAVGCEFALLLDMRFRQALAAGRTPAQARADATREIGGAVALSASTVAVGFGVLAVSRLPLLAQLGWLVALELAVCLVVALLVVPAAAERLELRGPSRARAPRLHLLRAARR